MAIPYNPTPPRRGLSSATRMGRNAVAQFVHNNIHNMQAWFDEIPESREKLEILLKLLDYYVPRLARVESISNIKIDLPKVKVEFVQPVGKGVDDDDI